MNEGLFKRASANTATATVVSLLVGPSLALSLAAGQLQFVADVPEDASLVVAPAGMVRLAVEESLIRSQWTEFLGRAVDDDTEREPAPILPSRRTRTATFSLVKRGRGVSIG